MPVRDQSRYPQNWKAVSLAIRERAGQQCECVGECGLHPGQRCEERNGTFAKWAKGKIVLTVAHLNAEGGPCRCEPLCDIAEHLKAMCQRCHLRYDQELHQRNSRATRRNRKAIAELPL